MAFTMMACALVLALCAWYVPAQYSTCWAGDSDCHNCTTGNVGFDTIIWLGLEGTGHVEEFRANMQKAQAIMNRYPGVTSQDDWSIYHCSINYFCCHTEAEKLKVKQVLANLKWKPFNVSFAGTTCNKGPTEDHLSLYATANAATQASLKAFSQQIEQAVQAAGVPIHHPRQEAFHSTLGQGNLKYPADVAVQTINANVPVFTTKPIEVTWFYGPDGMTVHAS
eukprot:TRINITY_DN9850_c0_g1_i1.p2 TRINITY_DN9850_c0_g1~~TRINITY_DN9850_c0_g1_i1.p2  ORF type:complete len:223 (-),score=48.83 TRINITY_DN9850_c0_g1_i1:121-789(-)